MLDTLIKQHLTELLINVDTTALLDSLDAAQTDTELTTAWLPIVKNLCANYTVKRDDNTKYAEMVENNTISKLEPVAEYCVAQLDGKLSANAELADELIQLHFKVSSFYSLDGQHEKAFAWHSKSFAYITKQNLENTLNGTRFHNLLGGDIARLYQSGLIEDCPPAAREHFEIALATHKDLGNTLDKSADMRHIQMCLIHCIIEEVTDELLKGKIQLEAGKETATIKYLLQSATDFITELKTHIPESDLYRRAGILQNEANIQALQNNMYRAVFKASNAVELMSSNGSRSSGQLSKLLLESARIHIMFAAEIYHEIISGVESMAMVYGDKSMKRITPVVNSAKNELPEILKHPYAKLYLTIAGKQAINDHLHTDPLTKFVHKGYPDAQLLDSDLADIKFGISSIISPKDYEVSLRAARCMLMRAAEFYTCAATMQGPEQMYAKVAKNELGYLLDNPYVQSLKYKIAGLSPAQQDELFTKPSELGFDLLFSGGPATQPKVNFSKIVDLNDAQTAIKRSTATTAKATI